MTRLAIHFHDRAHTIVCNVTAYFRYGDYWHVRTMFGNCPEERMYKRENVIAIFEVKSDGQKRIL